MAWRAWRGKGLPGEPVREMLIEAVEKRFGTVEAIPPQHTLEFLSDNGGAYIAEDTRRIARSLGLKPINTPVCSPQSNGATTSVAWISAMRQRSLLSFLPRSNTSTRCIRTRA
jgi:transposase InsO family protein